MVSPRPHASAAGAPMRRPLVVSICLAALALAACGASNPALEDPHAAAALRDSPRLVGAWLDPESSTTMTIALVDGIATVTAVVDDDGEVYEVRESTWKDGHLRWTYFVPSTGYVTSFEVRTIGEAVLGTEWSGTGGSGLEQLVLVE